MPLIQPDTAPWIAKARQRRRRTWKAPKSAALRPNGIARPNQTHRGQNVPPPVSPHSTVIAKAMAPDTAAWTVRARLQRRSMSR